MTCNKKTMKSLNTKALLRFFLDADPVSQKKLQQATGLDKCTISVLVNQLREQGFVAVAGNGVPSQKGGRKEQFLDLNRGKITGLGMALRDMKLSAGLFDLNGNRLWETSFPISRNHSSVWAPLVLKTVKAIRAKCEKQGRLFLGAGFALGCLYNPEKNELVGITGGEEKNLPLRKLLNDSPGGAPVYADDFPNAMAAGEMWFGEAQGLRDFLYVQLFPARMTIVVDGKILRGHRFFAGEVGKSTGVRKFLGESTDRASLFSDPLFLDWLFDLTLYFDPRKIIISNESSPSLTPEAAGKINRFIGERYNALYPGFDAPDPVCPGALGAGERVKAAAALVFQNYFYPDLINPKKETICRQAS
jgi:hypothetical protein